MIYNFDPNSIGVLANPDLQSGMRSMGLGSGMGGGGGGGGGGIGGSGMGGADVASAGLGLVKEGVNLVGAIDSIFMRHKLFKEEKRQFNKTFDENVRQFGLNYALREYATKQGISLEKAKQLYDAETLALNKQTAGENIRTSALGRQMAATKFAYEKQDRAKQEKIGKALQKGIVSGLLGGA